MAIHVSPQSIQEQAHLALATDAEQILIEDSNVPIRRESGINKQNQAMAIALGTSPYSRNQGEPRILCQELICTRHEAIARRAEQEKDRLGVFRHPVEDFAEHIQPGRHDNGGRRPHFLDPGKLCCVWHSGVSALQNRTVIAGMDSVYKLLDSRLGRYRSRCRLGLSRSRRGIFDLLLDLSLGDNLFSRLRSNRLKRRGSRRGHVISETRQIEIFVRHIERFLGFQLQSALGPTLVAFDSGRLRGFAECAIRARAHQ
ncbi:hypothetical protein IB232_22135 [Pseudomonas sp. PDM15]|uniref:hypothetical protein n=1 Tax=Pseudomonas sp. PDM15 TaxID=2769303 RepID=UPI001781E35A|nr:hypothetical protein [Pseudomonas sp. PDM15]MBD9428041.1 hypothetical protein [Pseudomonas sp. PDM15]